MTRNDHAWLALLIATLVGASLLAFLVFSGSGPQGALG
jgi:hypothetical protein